MIDIDRFKALNDTLRPRRPATRSCARSAARSSGAVRDDDVPGPLRRRGVRRAAAQPGTGDRARGRRAGARRGRRRSTCASLRRAGRQRLGRRRRRRAATTSRSATSIERPTGRSTAPSAPAATGSSRAVSPATIGAMPDGHDDGPTRRRRLTNGDLAADLPRDRRHARGQGRARLQDRRLPPRGGRHRAQPGRPRRGLPRAARRRRSPGSAQAISDKIAELADDRPHGASTTGSRPRSRPALVELLRIPGLGPKTVRPAPRRARASRRSTTCGPPPRPAGCDGLRGMSGEDRGARSSRASPGSRRDPGRMLLDAGRGAASTGSSRRSRTRPACAALEPAGSFRRRRRRSATSTSSPRPTTPAGAHRALHGARRRRPRRQPGRLQGGGAAAARPAGRPDGHAARRGRHVPASTSPARRSTTSGSASDGPRPGLEPVREGLPAASARTASR